MPPRRLPLVLVIALSVALLLSARAAANNALPIYSSQPTAAGSIAPLAVFNGPTNSSPIVVSNGGLLVWSVNPDDGSVSVIDAAQDVEIARIRVGHEPQSVAIDPNTLFAYVANAADNSVSVIRIISPAPASFAAVVETTLTTGAEPWNLVVSPDGLRVFVANSGQDTITIINSGVTFPTLPSVIGNVDLRSSACNVGGADRHFQPRGLAVTIDSARLYVTRFLSFTTTGGVQASNTGKEGLVCRLDIDTGAATVADSVTAFVPLALPAQDSGFPPGTTEQAYPNQLQSVVLRGDRGFIPNIASAPAAPLRFNSDTHAFVSTVDGVNGATQTAGTALNLHLGARIPETGKTKLFFASPWAMAFTTQSGAGNAYVVSASSDLLVKLNVDVGGQLTFTGGISTTRYIDLNDPANTLTSGRGAGKNPLGIALRDTGVPAQRKLYVMNYISRNVTVVSPDTDAVTAVINLTNLPPPGTVEEQLLVGKEVFFSSRGNFDRPSGTTVSTVNRLSSEGWQSCGSCHFAGLTDGNIWAFGSGPRKSVPMNGTFSPHNPDDQRLLNYSAIFDEVQDFELNIRNVSGPGPLPGTPSPGLDPAHGLLFGDNGDRNAAPGAVNAFALPNAGRPQHTLTLPGSTTAWPALDALREWVRFSIRTPNGMLTTAQLTAGGGTEEGGLSATAVAAGRLLFFRAGCQTCHGGTKWTTSNKDFVSPPAAANIATENPPTATTVAGQYLPAALKEIGSFGLGVAGGANPIGSNVGGAEVGADGKNGLGRDDNGDGKGAGFNVPSLLGIWAVQPYYHNGACETLACVLSDVRHRTANNTRPDLLTSPTAQANVVAFLQTLDAETEFPTDLSVRAHDIFFDPPVVFQSTQVVVGANVSLFGTRADLDAASAAISVRFSGPGLDVAVPLGAFTQDFGQKTVTTTWTVPATPGVARITVQVDDANTFTEANEANNTSARNVLVRTAPPDTEPPVVQLVRLSDDDPFNENDPIATTSAMKVRIRASDSGPGGGSGLAAFCVVGYHYDAVQRRWVESDCTFQPLPAPDTGTTDTFTANASIRPFEGAAYAFVWVRDQAGNISRVPGFDVISFIPSTPINLNRNDIRIFRIQLTAGQSVSMTMTPSFGDIDLSLFDNVTATATRIAISANNGTTPETVTFTNTFGATRSFQVEVRAIVNSRFQVAFQQLVAQAASPDMRPAGVTVDPLPTTPVIAGPPALQTAVGEQTGTALFLPLASRGQ